MGEDFECDNRSRAVAKDGCRLGRSMLNQAPDVIGISSQPVMIVLRPVERTVRKTTAVVGHHLILCRKFVYEREEDLPHAGCPWNQDQEWPGACDLIRQLRPENFEGTHTLFFFLT